jgi:diguanylate cyclase (GGDEF)-like protein
LQHSLEQAKNAKSKNSFSLIIGDLDEFKKINDTWGHPEGDRALTMTAKFLSKCSQQYNASVYRMGGDEFAIIVNSSDPASAQALCDNIQSSIRSIAFRDDCVLSMSLGRVIYDGTMNSIELLNQADAKLYEEKASKKSILF